MFRFRLQRVLELREKKEQERALELARAESEAERARLERDRLTKLHSTSRDEVSAAHQSEPTVGHLVHLGFVLNALDERLNQAVDVVHNAEGVVSQARTSLDDAARDRRVMDRLKDKQADAHRVGESYRDRTHMDEIALARFTRHSEAQRIEDARGVANAAADNNGTSTNNSNNTSKHFSNSHHTNTTGAGRNPPTPASTNGVKSA